MCVQQLLLPCVSSYPADSAALACVLGCPQVKAQYDIVADNTRVKLAGLPHGDFEEEDGELDSFVQTFQQVFQ